MTTSQHSLLGEMFTFPTTSANNTDSLDLTAPPPAPRTGGDITTLAQYLLLLKITLAPRFIISFGGIYANILNIRTFLRIGLEDSVTIAFFNLAISDLISLFTGFACTVALVVQWFELEFGAKFQLSPFYITVICVITDRIFKDATVLTTAFLGIQRSLCVLMPLHFKGMFTRFRTLVILLLLWAHAIASGSSHIAQYQFKKIFNPATNTSIYIMLFGPAYEMVNSVLNVMNGIILNVVCQTVVSVCVFILAYELNKSVRFRQASSNLSTTTTAKKEKQLDDDKGKSDAASKSLASNTKEKQAITQVTIVCIIFLITNLPLLITSFVELFYPGLALFKQYHYTFISYFNIRLIIESINSAVNFFVYYKYNTKFRQLCFGKGKKT